MGTCASHSQKQMQLARQPTTMWAVGTIFFLARWRTTDSPKLKQPHEKQRLAMTRPFFHHGFPSSKSCQDQHSLKHAASTRSELQWEGFVHYVRITMNRSTLNLTTFNEQQQIAIRGPEELVQDTSKYSERPRSVCMIADFRFHTRKQHRSQGFASTSIYSDTSSAPQRTGQVSAPTHTNITSARARANSSW